MPMMGTITDDELTRKFRIAVNMEPDSRDRKVAIVLRKLMEKHVEEKGII